MAGIVKQYYSLTKPHVTYGNVLSTAAGFLLAAGNAHSFDVWLFAAAITGTTLVIAAACVLNNYLDQDIDRVMERTKTRVVASGQLPGRNAVVFSILLGIVGIVVLAVWVNWLVVAIGTIGFVTYVWLYGAWSKRRSVHGTLVGSISGALPIVAGYCAATNTIDVAAVLLFACLFFWQFPEFYSISIYRRKEYKAAKIPVMSVAVSVKSTINQIFIYTVLFVVSSLMLAVAGYTGYVYAVVMGTLGLYWIWLAAQGFKTRDSEAWARMMFHKALLVLMMFSVMLPLGAVLP